MGHVRVRRWVGLVGLVAGLLGCSGLVPAEASAKTTTSPVVLHLKWRPVATQVTAVATSDHYLAIQRCTGSDSACTTTITLVDTQTGHEQTVADPAGCCGTAPTFGGPYLAIDCGADNTVWLYNVNDGEWNSYVPECPEDCTLIGVGSRWLKFSSDGGPDCAEHCPDSFYLQDVATGLLEQDPATPGGTTVENLNASSGNARLCTPLRYPIALSGYWDTQILGTLQFAGPFALASGSAYSVRQGLYDTYYLERCGSRKVVNLGPESLYTAPLISSRAIVTTGITRLPCPKAWQTADGCLVAPYVPKLEGWYLPGLERFTASYPNVPQSDDDSLRVEAVASVGNTVYADAPAGETLWSATLPPPPTSHR